MADKISSLVDEGVYSNFDKLNKKLDENTAAFIKAYDAADKYNGVVSRSATLKDFTDNQVKAAGAISQTEKQLEQTRLTEIRLQQAREKAFDVYERKLAKQQSLIDSASAKDARRNDKAIADDQKKASIFQKNADRQAALLEKQAKAQERANAKVAEAELPYNKLKASLAAAEKEASNIGASLGTSSDEFINASKNVQGLRKQVDAIEQPLGKFQRNVGNYAQTAFNGIKTIANILPGLGLSGAFLAIFTGFQQLYELFSTKGFNATQTLNELNKKSNDIYAEQATSVKLLYAEVQAGNLTQQRSAEIIKDLNKVSPQYFGNIKNQQDLIKQLPGDYERYNEALLLNSRVEAAKSLITDEYKKQLEAQRKGIIANTREQELQGKATSDFGKTINSLYNIASGGFNLSLIDSKQIKDANNEISRSQKAINFLTADVLKSQAAIQRKGGSINGDGGALLTEQAQATIEQQKELLSRQIDFNKNIADDTKRSYASRRIALKAYYEDQQQSIKLSESQSLLETTLSEKQRTEIVSKATTSLLMAQREYNTSLKELNSNATKDRVEALDSEVEKRKAVAKRVFDDESKSLDARYKAVSTYEKASQRLIKDSYGLQIEDAGQNGDKVKALNSQLQEALTNTKIEAVNMRQQLSKFELTELEKEYNVRIALSRKQDAKTLSDLNLVSTKRIEQISKDSQDALDALGEQRAKGQISERVYQEKLTDIEYEATQERLKEQVRALQVLINIKKSAGLETSADEVSLSKVQQSIDKSNTDYKLKNFKTEAERRKELHDQELQLGKEALSAAQTISQGIFQARLDGIQKQQEAVDKQAEYESGVIEKGIGTAREKARKQAFLDEDTANKKKQLDAESAKIRKQQAIAERAANVAAIVANTAVAISKTLAEGGILFSPLIGVIAALGAVQIATVLSQPLPAFKDGGTHKGGRLLWGEAGTELAITPGGRAMLSPNAATIDNMPAGTRIFNNSETMRMMAKPDHVVRVGGRDIDISSLVASQDKTTAAVLKLASGGGKQRGVVKSGLSNSYLKRNGL